MVVASSVVITSAVDSTVVIGSSVVVIAPIVVSATVVGTLTTKKTTCPSVWKARHILLNPATKATMCISLPAIDLLLRSLARTRLPTENRLEHRYDSASDLLSTDTEGLA